MKDQVTSQSGFNIVALVVGIALSLMSAAAASAFYVKNQRLTAAIAGESQAMAHLAIMLKQAFTRYPNGVEPGPDAARNMDNLRCLKLVDRNTLTFQNRSGSVPFLLTTVDAKAANFQEQISYMSNGASKGYTILGFQVVQKSPIIGRFPSRVLADLVVTVSLKGESSGNKTLSAQKDFRSAYDGRSNGKKEKLRTLTVPLLLDLDSRSLKPIGCMNQPSAKEMCEQEIANGTRRFDERTQTCN